MLNSPFHGEYGGSLLPGRPSGLPPSSLIRKAPAIVIAAQPRARRLVEIVRFNAQDARQFSDPLVRDAIASVFIAADLPRRYVGGVGKLAHCHPAMLTVFLQALSDVWIDGSLAIHEDHPPNAKNGRGHAAAVV